MEEKIYKKLYLQFYSIAKTFQINEDIESLYHEFLIQKWKNGLNFKNSHYLNVMIKNFLINKFNEKKRKEIPDEIKIEIKIKDEIFIPEIYSEIVQFFEIIKKELKEREIKILCYYVNSEKYYFFKDMSRDAKYKAIERVKKRLRNIQNIYNFSEEAVKVALEKFFQSEICDKIC